MKQDLDLEKLVEERMLYLLVKIKASSYQNKRKKLTIDKKCKNFGKKLKFKMN